MLDISLQLASNFLVNSCLTKLYILTFFLVATKKYGSEG